MAARPTPRQTTSSSSSPSSACTTLGDGFGGGFGGGQIEHSSSSAATGVRLDDADVDDRFLFAREVLDDI